MKIIKISCYSKCGSYFGIYLQFVILISENKESAIKYVKEETELDFIYPEKEWNVEELTSDIIIDGIKPMVIDHYYDSDY